MLDKSKARRHGRSKKTRAGEEFPLLDLKKAAKAFRSVPGQLPQWKEKLGAAARAGGEKLGAAYSAVARVVAQQKEAFQDRRAEKRSRANAAARSKKKKSASRRKK